MTAGEGGLATVGFGSSGRVDWLLWGDLQAQMAQAARGNRILYQDMRQITKKIMGARSSKWLVCTRFTHNKMRWPEWLADPIKTLSLPALPKTQSGTRQSYNNTCKQNLYAV
jgi:hypothetical protein